MKREDTLPWYRQFWPWFIMALPAAAVVAGLYTVWLAMQTHDSLVVDAGAGVNVITARNSAAEQIASNHSLRAEIHIDAASGAVLASVPTTPATAADRNLTLQLRHPTLADLDQTIELFPAMPNAAGETSWAGHFVTIPSGRRYVILSSGNGWRLSGEWSGQASLQLTSLANGDR